MPCIDDFSRSVESTPKPTRRPRQRRSKNHGYSDPNAPSLHRTRLRPRTLSWTICTIPVRDARRVGSTVATRGTRVGTPTTPHRRHEMLSTVATRAGLTGVIRLERRHRPAKIAVCPARLCRRTPPLSRDRRRRRFRYQSGEGPCVCVADTSTIVVFRSRTDTPLSGPTDCLPIRHRSSLSQLSVSCHRTPRPVVTTSPGSDRGLTSLPESRIPIPDR